MLKIYQLIAILLVSLSISCAQEDFITTDTGLTYKYATRGSGERPDDGNYITMNIAYFNQNGYKIFSSIDRGELSALGFVDSLMIANGSIEECFGFIGKGDSVILEVNAEKLFTESFRRPLPDSIAADSKITIYVGIHDIYTPEEYQEYRMAMFEQAQEKEMAMAGEQLATDVAIIDEFLASEGIDAVATDEGIRYVILEQGDGPLPQPGQKVRVNYTGTLITGEMFDSNDPEAAKKGNVYNEAREYVPYEFALGAGQVIEGWDIGVGLLNVGTKARLYIPSPLAYGARQRSEVITANAILVFDVELVGIAE